MTEELKLCKDCKYNKDVYCFREDEISLVTGEMHTHFEFCNEERATWFFGCGKKGKYFEAKEKVQ